MIRDDLAHLRALVEGKDDMLKRETPMPKASFKCPVCGVDTPHAHTTQELTSEIFRLKALAAAPEPPQSLDLERENKNLRQHLAYALPFVAERARKGSGHAAGIEMNIRELLDLWNEHCDCDPGTCESKSFVKCLMAWEIENGIRQ